MFHNHLVCLIAGIIAALGAINWGFRAMNKDLVVKAFKSGSTATKVVYYTFAVAGVVSLVCLIMWAMEMNKRGGSMGPAGPSGFYYF